MVQNMVILKVTGLPGAFWFLILTQSHVQRLASGVVLFILAYMPTRVNHLVVDFWHRNVYANMPRPSAGANGSTWINYTSTCIACIACIHLP